MPKHAELLIVARLLPANDSPSLALSWDIHMMCNVGGRERTASHYRRLLFEAGFALTAGVRAALGRCAAARREIGAPSTRHHTYGDRDV